MTGSTARYLLIAGLLVLTLLMGASGGLGMSGAEATVNNSTSEYPHEGGREASPIIEEGAHGPFEIDNGQTHYFAVELEEGDELNASIYFDHADGDLDLAVDDPDYNLIDEATSVTDNEAVSLEAAEDGIHYIRPYGFANASNSYELEIEVNNNVSGAHEQGYEEAPVIHQGVHGPFEIHNGQSHYFGVELGKGDKLEAAIYFDHDEGDLDLSVEGPNQDQIDEGISTNDNETVLIEANTSGMHYIRPYGFAGASNSYDLGVSIRSNITPHIAVQPEEPTEEDEIWLDATNSTVENEEIKSYGWDFGNTGTVDITGEQIQSSLSQGSHEVALVVEGEDGRTTTTTETIYVSSGTSVEPGFSFEPKDPQPGEQVVFDASETAVEHDDIANYTWQFPSRVYETDGKEVRHRFEPGTHSVELNVTATDGRTVTTTDVIEVTEDGTTVQESKNSTVGASPQPEFTVMNDELREENPIRFDASDSDVPAGEVAEFKWRFGDDTSVDKEGEEVEYNFSPGVHPVTLTIEDETGRQAETTDLIEVAPSTVEGDMWVDRGSIAVGSEAIIQYRVENFRENDSLNVQWTAEEIPTGLSFVDDSSQQQVIKPGEETTMTQRVVLNEAGEYSMTGLMNYWFEDDRDDGGRKRESVNITAVSPEEVAGHIQTASSTVAVGEEVTFDGSSSKGEVVEYQWRFGDGRSTNGPVVTHNYNEPGEYDVTLVLKGKENLNTSTMSITVVSQDSNAGEASKIRSLSEALIFIIMIIFTARALLFLKNR